METKVDRNRRFAKLAALPTAVTRSNEFLESRLRLTNTADHQIAIIRLALDVLVEH
jgi:hypothetical protein